MQKIVVHESNGVIGNDRIQQVDLFFKYVGEIELSEEERMDLKPYKSKGPSISKNERNALYRAKKKAERLAVNDGHLYPQKICDYCGKPFWPNYSTELSCSAECKAKKRKIQQKAAYEQRYPDRVEAKNAIRICAVCGTEFTSHKYNQICCSKECSAIHNAEMQRARRKRRGPVKSNWYANHKKRMAENPEYAMQEHKKQLEYSRRGNARTKAKLESLREQAANGDTEAQAELDRLRIKRSNASTAYNHRLKQRALEDLEAAKVLAHQQEKKPSSM